MKSIVQGVLIMNRTVPEGFDSVKDIRSHIRETRSGIILGSVNLIRWYDIELLLSTDLTYQGSKVSIDIVSLIPMTRTQMKEVVRIFPGFDQRKLQSLQTSKLISNRDGIIAKNENWRLSFSNSESRVFRKVDNVLYKSLKYLSSVSGLNIKTYFIKVIFWTCEIFFWIWFLFRNWPLPILFTVICLTARNSAWLTVCWICSFSQKTIPYPALSTAADWAARVTRVALTCFSRLFLFIGLLVAFCPDQRTIVFVICFLKGKLLSVINTLVLFLFKVSW